jgi:hypothetical protein
MEKTLMAAVEPSALANSIMASLYDVLTNGDDTVPQSEDNFFTWSTPGIPVGEEAFTFLTQGLTGIVKKAALDEMRTTDESGNTTGQPELTPAELEALRAQDTAGLYQQAESFARLVDFVPDLASNTNEQFARLSIMNNEGTLSERYEYILRMSQVMQSELPEETKKKIEKFRGLLSVTKTKKNLIDDSETQVSEPSPLVQIYNEKLQAYEASALDYNTHRIDALAGDNAKAIHYWSINANILRNRVKAAMTDWVTNGYKNDYEAIGAFIDQVMQRDMALLKEQYRDDLEKARLTGTASGSDFYYTSLSPANFAQSAGWTEFSFSAIEYNRYKNSSFHLHSSSKSAGGGFFGLVAGGGSASSANAGSEFHGTFDSDRFSLRFKIAQVPIVRPWFKTSFLVSNTWRFDQSNPEAKSMMLNDGGTPASGFLPAYPTTMVFIKDLSMYIGESSGFSDFVASYQKSSASGGGFLSLGPIHLGGSYSKSSISGSSSSNVHYDANTQTMTVPGMQVVGFKCHVLPKSPAPLAGITQWI